VNSDPRIQKDYLQFIKDINDEIADRPVANNPMSNISFMTEPPKFGGHIKAAGEPDSAVPHKPSGSIALPPALAMPAPEPKSDKIKPPSIILPPVPQNIKNKPATE
jgi:hypothetical protein